MSLLRRLLNRPPTGDKTEPGVAGSDQVAEEVLELIRRQLSEKSIVLARRGLDALDARFRTRPEVRLLLGQCLRLEGRLDEAWETFDSLLAEGDDPATVQLELALCHIDRNEIQPAKDCLEVAVTLNPALGLAWLKLGEVLYRLESDDALAAFQRAIDCLDDFSALSDAWFRIGRLRFVANDVEGAAVAFENALKARPDSIEAMTAVADTVLMLDREDEAVRHYEQAVQRNPHLSRSVLTNMSAALHYCGRYDEASRVLKRVLAQHPNDHVARCYLGQLQLAQCDWQDGWRNFEARYSSGAVPFRPMPYPQWSGQSARTGTLLILADEGIGDEIMYASCLAEATSRVGQVIVECEKRLQSLFARSFPQVHVVGTRRQNDPGWLKGLPQPNWQIPASELPALFRLNDSDFPVHRGYLQADPQRVAAWKERLKSEHGGKWTVGISWRGGTPKTRGRARTIASEHWQPILDTRNVAFVNLQYGRYGEELAELNRVCDSRIHDYPDALADYDETAALVASLDLVVSVCTAVVHLAGALGRPVWVLTPLAPGWRYTTSRNSMPWYPSSRLFRQPEVGDWASTCQILANELGGLTKNVTDDRGLAVALVRSV